MVVWSMKRLSAEKVTVGVVLESLSDWDSIPGGLIVLAHKGISKSKGSG